MGGSSSSSTTTTSSSTEQKDQKVTGDNSLNIGSGATLTVNEEFDEDVKQAFMSVIDLANSSINKLSTNQEQSLSVIKERFENQESDINKISAFAKPIVIAGGIIGTTLAFGQVVKNWR